MKFKIKKKCVTCNNEFVNPSATKTTKQIFFEEQKKAIIAENLKRKKRAEAKKYSIPQQAKTSTVGQDPVDTSLLLDW